MTARRADRRGASAGGLLAAAALLACAGLAEAQVSFGVNRVLQVDGSPDGTAIRCDNLLQTLASLDNPSAINRYLIRLEPADYTCPSFDSIVIPDGVTLQGASWSSTVLAGGKDDPLRGVFHLEGTAELRDLTIVNVVDSPASDAIVVSVFSFGTAPDVKLEDVRLISEGPADQGISLAVIGSTVEVAESKLEGLVRATGSSLVTLSHTNLREGYSEDESSIVRCILCSDGLTPLGATCDP